jgi:hypothetical protein
MRIILERDCQEDDDGEGGSTTPYAISPTSSCSSSTSSRNSIPRSSRNYYLLTLWDKDGMPISWTKLDKHEGEVRKENSVFDPSYIFCRLPVEVVAGKAPSSWSFTYLRRDENVVVEEEEKSQNEDEESNDEDSDGEWVISTSYRSGELEDGGEVSKEEVLQKERQLEKEMRNKWGVVGTVAPTTKAATPATATTAFFCPHHLLSCRFWSTEVQCIRVRVSHIAEKYVETSAAAMNRCASHDADCCVAGAVPIENSNPTTTPPPSPPAQLQHQRHSPQAHHALLLWLPFLDDRTLNGHPLLSSPDV